MNTAGIIKKEAHMDSYYSESAYRKDKCPTDNPTPAKSGLWQGLSTHTQYTWHNTYNYINPFNRQFPSCWHLDYDYQSKGEAFPAYWPLTHEVWKTDFEEDASEKSDSFLLASLGAFAFPTAYIFLAPCLFVVIFGLFAGKFYPLYFIIPLIIFIICTFAFTLSAKSAAKHYKRNKWMGNGFFRRTGKVVRNKTTYDFTDFCAVVERAPMTNGMCHFNLVMQHRLNAKVSLLVFQGGANVDECCRAWEMLLRFMDVEEPLPNVPDLAPFRHLDPTTAAYDKQYQDLTQLDYWYDLYNSSYFSHWKNFLHDLDGRNKDCDLVLLEEAHRKISNGAMHPKPPHIPLAVYQQWQEEGRFETSTKILLDIGELPPE